MTKKEKFGLNNEKSRSADEVFEIPEAEETAEVPDVPEMTPEELADLLIKMGKEKEAAEERYLRLQADFDNFRKRTQREKDDTVKQSNAALLRMLLPVADNLERAGLFTAETQPAAVIEGIQKILKQLIVIFAMNNVEVIKTLDESFDPNFHEAVMQEDAGDEKSGRIIEELQKGYLLDGKLLRAAMVKVGK